MLPYYRTPERIRSVLQHALQCGFSEVPELLVEDENIPLTDSLLRYIQIALHDVFTSQTGATHYTPFYIFSRKAHRPYWFLHLANNSKANDVVKEIHWQKHNRFMHFGRPGLSMLGFDPEHVEDERQMPLLVHEFDEAARERTVTALTDELPIRLRQQFNAGVDEPDLVAAICNETPATQAHIHQAVRRLQQEKLVYKQGKLIVPSPQKSFFYARRRES